MRLLAACFAAASAATWQYTQNEETPEGCSTHHACGPANWKLVDQSAACADKSTGNADQSPINLNMAKFHPTLKSLQLGESICSKARLENNGHTWKIVLDEKLCKESVKLTHTPITSSSADVPLTCFLKQIHFHSPSEHAVGSGRYDMEAHHVFSCSDSTVTVVAMFLEAISQVDNAFMDKFWKAGFNNQTTTFPSPIDPGHDFFPASPDYYAYTGSFTTPPCTTGVSWIAMKEPVLISKVQLNAFLASMATSHSTRNDGTNNRPLMPLGIRTLFEFVESRGVVPTQPREERLILSPGMAEGLGGIITIGLTLLVFAGCCCVVATGMLSHQYNYKMVKQDDEPIAGPSHKSSQHKLSKMGTTKVREEGLREAEFSSQDYDFLDAMRRTPQQQHQHQKQQRYHPRSPIKQMESQNSEPRRQIQQIERRTHCQHHSDMQSISQSGAGVSVGDIQLQDWRKQGGGGGGGGGTAHGHPSANRLPYNRLQSESEGTPPPSNGRQYAGPGLVHADQHSPADSDMEVDSIQRSSEFGI